MESDKKTAGYFRRYFVYLLKEGYKASKFFGPSGEFKYWYCDIIKVLYDEDEDKYTLVDLLLDVKIMPTDGWKFLMPMNLLRR